MMQCEILREVLFFFFVALRSNWKVIVLVYGFPELRHAVYLFSYLCNVFMSPLHQQPLEIQSQSRLVQATVITSAYGMHFRCKQQDFVTHESIARNGIFGGGGGGCSCNRTKEMTGVLFFPLSQP